MTLALGKSFLETDRLRLRRITAQDLTFYARIHADPDVARFLSHGRPRSEAETDDWFDMVSTSYASLQLGQLAVERKSDGALLGRCGVSDILVESAPSASRPARSWYAKSEVPAGVTTFGEFELGYTFAKAYWGQGYALESARVVYDYVRKERKISRIVSLIHPDNAGSLKLAQKCGATKQDSFESLGRLFDCYVWP